MLDSYAEQSVNSTDREFEGLHESERDRYLFLSQASLRTNAKKLEKRDNNNKRAR
jgi:hypothetical protein